LSYQGAESLNGTSSVKFQKTANFPSYMSFNMYGIQPLTKQIEKVSQQTGYIGAFEAGIEIRSGCFKATRWLPDAPRSGLTGIIGAWVTLHPGWAGQWNKKSHFQLVTLSPLDSSPDVAKSYDDANKYIRGCTR